MSLAQNKRGIELVTVIEIFLVVLAGGLIISVFTAKSSEANEKTSENLCRGFNAIRFGTQLETPIGNYNIAPRACKTIDKKDLPGKDYKYHIDGPKEGAKAEIRDLIAKCWRMWLEGNQKNIFESKWYNLQNGCFVCYTFSIDKSAGSFSYQEFAKSLDKPYYVIDDTDRCAPGGQGGKCMSSCNTVSDYFSKEIASNRCPNNQKCCIAEDSIDECKNKGGKCFSSPEAEYALDYDKWRCKSGKCYVKIDNMASYLDYVERVGGTGRIVNWDDSGFNQGSKYAVTFMSPGNSWNINTVLGLGGTTLLGGVTVVGIVSGFGTLPTLLAVTTAAKTAIVGGALTTGAVYLTGNTGNVNNINIIGISKYDTVASKCAIEAGVGQK